MDFGPISPLIGALIGALGATLLFVLGRERKRVVFFVEAAEDLTLALRKHHTIVALRIGDQEVLNLNRAAVQVRNTGNSAIQKFAFDIVVPGVHKLAIAEKSAEDAKLADAIIIQHDDTAFDTTFQVSIPFFNKKERFEVFVLFDGKADEVKVHCRMENLRYKIHRGQSVREDVLAMLALSMQRSGRKQE
jgi:hypothetical protein